jgi:uncharacterized peroxidase-related enzyme
VAWVRAVRETQAHGRLAEVYRACLERDGRVVELLKAQSQRPACLEAFAALSRACLFGDGSLPVVERELIALVVSCLNGCHYSVELHGREAMRLCRDESLVREVRDDWRRARLSPRTRAVLAYAEKLTGSPARMAAADVVTLRAHGLDEGEILDVVEIASFVNLENRIAQALHVDIEEGMAPYPAPGSSPGT